MAGFATRIKAWLLQALCGPLPTPPAIDCWRPEQVRVRFAWRPTALWVTGTKYARQTGETIWFRYVVEVETLWGWTAYKRHQALTNGGR
ncbi:hypothetical protein [Azospirillum argentinense]|uniref:hypothetical protein n=1 Tax=Azospirillum argentinense TaxID=2970906 RepID=UPI0010C0340F|nr:hypothetical protein [Azospirillum argentinense]